MKSSLIVLTSPPASGKTYWIKSFKDVLFDEPLLVVSPLRALADECKLTWEGKIEIMTPEEWLVSKKTYRNVIFDEFHLYFYWGDSFRSTMWEVFFELSTQCELCILLTATLNESMQLEMVHFKHQFDEMIWYDYGNQKLKFNPKRYFVTPSRNWMMEKILLTSFQTKTVSLLFCAYRSEVFEVAKKLRQAGYRVWTCVGGESKEMSHKMQTESAPHFIVATTVLSHGVNLPKISSLYFLYPLENIDFWIQMVARGGRKGESYEVYALEKPYGLKWSRSINSLAILLISLRMKIIHFFRQYDQWFLKDC